MQHSSITVQLLEEYMKRVFNKRESEKRDNTRKKREREKRKQNKSESKHDRIEPNRTYYHLLDQLFTKKHNLQERIKGKFALLIYINI